MEFPSKNLDLALRLLESGDWQRFERLARAFLVEEFADLRVTAAPSGDGGRDAELFMSTGRPKVMFQFSVQEDWKSKIVQTVDRIKEKFGRIDLLVYLTNQEVGAKADELRDQYRKRRLVIDVRDRSWFVDRVNLGENRQAAARELFDNLVAPIINLKAPGSGKGSLSSDEARTLLCFLELQHDDEATDKGLTKISFEALVRAALRDTSADRRIDLSEIQHRIQRLLPQHDPEKLRPYIEGALSRLVRTVVKYYPKTGEYHISHDEYLRLVDRATDIASMRLDFLSDLAEAIATDSRIEQGERKKCLDYAETLIEIYLHDRGEQFAEALRTGSILVDSVRELERVIQNNPPPKLKSKESAPTIFQFLLNGFLRTPSTKTLAYLKLLSDSYTLFAFLVATPDVQKVTQRLFNQGEIWLDTTIILPAIAEAASNGNEPFEKPFTTLFRQIRHTGIQVFATPGVIEEAVSHLKRCVTFSRVDRWHGDIPFVASQFLLAGNARAALPRFVEEFIGEDKPEEDLEGYLAEELGITVRPPGDLDSVPEPVRHAIGRYWLEVHTRRRTSTDEMALARLAKHDEENYENVLVRRSLTDQGNWFGYTSWWLTLDGAARVFLQQADPEVVDAIKGQPVLSLDFVMRYLTFGPLRSRLDRSYLNPLEIFSPSLLETVPAELIAVADRVRQESGNLSERLRRRKIRTEIDHQRMTYGRLHSTAPAQAAEVLRGSV